MRYQGKVKVWKDDKGFGFILPNGGGLEPFLHISAFSNRSKRPKVGDLVTYELSMTEPNRPKATNVRFVSDREHSKSRESSPLPALFVAVLILGFIGYIGYVRLSHPNSTVAASLYKVFFARSALNNQGQFECSPSKTYCSQMTSCSEAFFHQEQCGVKTMDGDRNGIPCEQQWCN
jgi:cold shock CspA family protein